MTQKELSEKGCSDHPEKQQSTLQLYEGFYGKPYLEITDTDIGPAEVINWGEDVGGEVIG